MVRPQVLEFALLPVWGSNNAEPTKLLKSIRKVKFRYFEYFDILILGNQFQKIMKINGKFDGNPRKISEFCQSGKVLTW